MANNTGVFRQKINSKIPSNNAKQVSAAAVREALEAGADAIDEIFETFLLANSIGEYDASTGIAKLTDTGATSTPGTTPAFDDGEYLDVVKDGTVSITGSPVAAQTGGVFIVRGVKWGYIPPSDLALLKTQNLEKLITNTTIEDYAFVWKDIDGKVCAYIDRAGAAKFLRWVAGSVPGSALGTFTGSDKIIAKTISLGLLTDDVVARIANLINIPGYRFVLNDSNGRYAVSIDEAGLVSIPKLSAPLFVAKKLSGKKVLCIGDSTSSALKYQPWIAEYTGATVTTHAKGGIGLVQMVDGDGSNPLLALTAAQLVDKDVVTIFGGLNDRSRLIGTRTDMYPAQQTIYARLNYVINSIYTLAATVGRKDIRVVLIAPHKVGKYNYIDADGGQEYPPASGQTLESIVNAIIDIGGFYGIPVVDLYRNSGINNYTWDTLTSNVVVGGGTYPTNPDNVHPNDAGYKLIGTLISSKLNSL